MNNGNGRIQTAECETGPDSLDREHVPLLNPDGIEAFLCWEVLPFASNACYDDTVQ